MTDKTELEVTAADDGKEYVIRKGGYFYRPNAEGYTSNANDAGRFSLKQAILHSSPNGPDGPRDGITYELATRTPDPTPVAWMYQCGRSRIVKENDDLGLSGYTKTPLYAHPPAVPADGLVEAAEMARVILMGVRPGLCMKPGGKVVSAGQALDALEAALAAHRGEA